MIVRVRAPPCLCISRQVEWHNYGVASWLRKATRVDNPMELVHGEGAVPFSGMRPNLQLPSGAAIQCAQLAMLGMDIRPGRVQVHRCASVGWQVWHVQDTLDHQGRGGPSGVRRQEFAGKGSSHLSRRASQALLLLSGGDNFHRLA